jgi:hypothetical protein
MAPPRRRSGGARIVGGEVAARFPESGPVSVLLIGEAPGPRGADRSGIPFWGDRAGRLVYRALADAGLAEVPDAAWAAWDGALLASMRLAPRLRGAALTNAMARCPTRDGRRFRAPTDRELRDPKNLDRIAGEIARAAARCPTRLRVIAFGGRARWLLDQLAARADLPPFAPHALPHPSAQGLLQAAPDHGRGCKLSDLQNAWARRLIRLLESSPV